MIFIDFTVIFCDFLQFLKACLGFVNF